MNVQKFNITVFGVILGTGGVALVSQSFVPLLTEILTYFLSALFIIFTMLFAVKTVKYPRLVKKEIQHPILGNFYALQPISAVILSILYRKLFPSPFETILLIYGSAAILALSVYLPYRFFAEMNIELSELHGGWFITPVATILVTNAVFLYPLNELNLIISLIYFGIGSILFMLILSVLFFRLLVHDLPPVELAPTNFIILAPIGILVVDILQIFNSADHIFATNLRPLAILVGSGLWGFGVWVVLVNLLLLVKYVRSGFPFHMGWWSYVFPSAAFTMGTVALSQDFGVFKSVSIFLYLCLVAIWAVVSLQSSRVWLKSLLKQEKTTAISRRVGQ